MSRERRGPRAPDAPRRVGIRVSEIVTGLFEDSLSREEQIAFGQQLADLAEGFRQRVRRTPLVLEQETT